LTKHMNMQHYLVQLRIISLNIPSTSTLFPQSQADRSLVGVYFKVKRGGNRIIGKNRYVIYANAESGMTLIDEQFVQRSVFFRNQNDKLYQEKKLGIKLKQETSGAGKDRVLAHIKIDIARFVGKENVMYEVNLEGSDPGVQAKLTLELSITKASDQPIVTQATQGVGKPIP
jgi:hypothetical protein